jgi:hypothetical protein
MNNTRIMIALGTVAMLSLGSCGDNVTLVDGPGSSNGGFPPVPSLGAQIDRMGRPAINTALNHAFDASATTKGMAKDSYNQDTKVSGWPANYAAEFAANLALIDAVDYGLDCSGATCVASVAAGGCGNQALFNNHLSGGGAPTATSYATLASLTADDQLYVDTSVSMCVLYLGVELGFVINNNMGGASIGCGGRAPSYDVMGFTYGAIAVGVNSVNLTTMPPSLKTPKTGPMVGPHMGVSDAKFPFFAVPH